MAVRGEDAEDEGDPGEKERRSEREDRKRNRRSLAVRIISLFRALSFVKSTWQYHCLSIKLKSLTPEYYSVKYPAGCAECSLYVPFCPFPHVHRRRRRTGSRYASSRTRVTLTFKLPANLLYD